MRLQEKKKVIIIITIMHNIKDTITHYKQGRSPRRNRKRKLKRSERSSWGTWPLHVECVLTHTHTSVPELPAAICCVCVFMTKASLAPLESAWPQLDAHVGRRRAPDARGAEMGRMDEALPPGQRKDTLWGSQFIPWTRPGIFDNKIKRKKYKDFDFA